jgi:hypothetical protein
VLASVRAATADAIKVVSVTATGLMAVFERVAPAFERASGHRLVAAKVTPLRLDLSHTLGVRVSFLQNTA